MSLAIIALSLVISAALLVLRIYAILPSRTAPKKRIPLRIPGSTCSLGVFLGSGGHTAEMKALLSSLDFERYTPRTYIACHGDEMSLRVVAGLESEKGAAGASSSVYDILLLPRARRVGQPPLSTLLSTLKTLLIALYRLFLLPLLQHPSKPHTDLLIINGPGTCVVLVLVSWIRRILGLEYTRIIYVESFARVKSLSLSGRLVRPFVDFFVVQWPALAAGRDGGVNVEYRGWLV